jgi:copper resistance protein C
MRGRTFLACGLVLVPGVVLAHAVLTKSSLGGRPVPAGQETAVTLEFNSRLEVGMTKVVLVDAGGKESPLTVAAGSKPGTLAVTLPPLTPGAYGLRYKVLATDGHVTESILRFKVAAPE